jgi:hypothetical protein
MKACFQGFWEYVSHPFRQVSLHTRGGVHPFLTRTTNMIGLGEMTFLQLSTTYSPPSVGGRSVG